MQSTETRTELSSKTREILSSIADTDLRNDVEAVAIGSTDALIALGRVHLPQDLFEESGDAEQGAVGQDMHVELAPYVLAALSAVNGVIERVSSAFIPPAGETAGTSNEDFDLEFDLVDGPTGEGSRLSAEKQSDGRTPREQVAEVAHAMAGMLSSRVASLGSRLRHALNQSDGWPLLAEIDDHKRSLSKGIQGLLFGVLGVFSETARREEILPQYRSAVREAVDLRAAIADLSYHIGRFNNAISDASAADLVPLVVGVADRVSRFVSRTEYRTLRPEDKRAVIDFRRTLYRLRYATGGVPVQELRRAIEGYSKFLEAMHAINHREVLVVHDRQRLNDALAKIEEGLELVVADTEAARGRLQGIVRLLSSVVGRHPDLDQALRSFGVTPLDTSVRSELLRWQSLVQSALAVVG